MEFFFNVNCAAPFLYLMTQIDEGEIHATINKKDGMVNFHDNPEKYDNPTLLRRLEDEVRKMSCKWTSLFVTELKSNQNLFFCLFSSIRDTY